MIFRPDLAQAVMDGRKTVTRRVVREDSPRSPWHPDRAPRLVGKRVAIQDGRGKPAIATARVASVERETFCPVDISDEEAKREGFADAPAFIYVWEGLHGNLEPVDVWRIELAEVQPVEEWD